MKRTSDWMDSSLFIHTRSLFKFMSDSKVGALAAKLRGIITKNNKKDVSVVFVVLPTFSTSKTDLYYNVGVPSEEGTYTKEDQVRRDNQKPYDTIFTAVQDDTAPTKIEGQRYQIIGVVQKPGSNRDILALRKHARDQ